MTHAVLATVLGMLLVVTDGVALRTHARAVDLFQDVDDVFRQRRGLANCLELLRRQAHLALRSAAARLAALACAALLAFQPPWQGWPGTAWSAGLVALAGVQAVCLIQVVDLARAANALAAELRRAAVPGNHHTRRLLRETT